MKNVENCLNKKLGIAFYAYHDIIPSLTLVKAKSGYKPSNYAGCSHFLFGNDLCYFFPYSVLVLFMMLRMADFEINS